MATIDSLELQIKSDSKSAIYGIDSLSKSLSRLKNTVQGGLGLDSISNQIHTFNSTITSATNNVNNKVGSL